MKSWNKPGKMYAVTSILRNDRIVQTKFCDETPSFLAPLISQYRTDCPPSHEQIMSLPDEDLIVRKDDCWRHYPRLVVFDMDSTLIEQECIDLLASYAGVEDEVSNITKRAMNGELDFTASLAARVALLRGLPDDVFDKVKERITFAPGARELCRALKRMGCQLAVISGGFVPLATYVQKELGLDYMYSNNLEVHAGKLTGVTYGPVVNAEMKKELLLKLQSEIGCRIEQVVAVGDGANDLPMLNIAGLGVAIHAKEKVQREAPARIRHGQLDAILYLFGLSSGKVLELCRQ
ncbi:Phosphoserine phosphatase [Taphrina deformans PYCC 5710]|uniref:phosphoserine phosphatase n=1 Tax=Taphrina deformans (strain PYCC 5710 / ATCC 11124 / CBS 356.35 / IMI 108563 / JCM 9778 / NBRC 8474) TaxID=1097556 RepID=R4XB22_TAPDE|nr:Phosphoserine phosphatase [Taphrina deformans PYCC 5710]|eukprot:CCG82785.1 Phosphoserine phosphatase [Taphrina deformans PYCC 5710]